MRQHVLCLGLASMLSLPACSRPVDSGTLKFNEKKSVTEYKPNPNPRQRYDITMTIADAPGPFASIEGSVSYDIANEECLPPMDEFIGAQTTRTRESIPVTYKEVSDDTYVGTLYADQMLEGDYFGRGVCRWQLGGASVTLKATGAPGETEFSAVLFPETLLVGQAETTYFQKKFYPRDPDIENLPSFGQTDRSKMSPSISDSDLFTVTLTPKAVTP